MSNLSGEQLQTLKTLKDQWAQYKHLENSNRDARRMVELKIKQLLAIDENKVSSDKFELSDGTELKISQKHKTTIDNDILRGLLAHENGAVLQPMIRWKAELDAKAYKSAPADLKAAIAPALVTKPAATEFKLTTPEKEND